MFQWKIKQSFSVFNAVGIFVGVAAFHFVSILMWRWGFEGMGKESVGKDILIE